MPGLQGGQQQQASGTGAGGQAGEGQGGVAGFGKGHAEVKLSPEGEATLLKYDAQAQVGGKIAQIGSRLVASAAAKVSDSFFKAFETKMAGLSS